MAFLIRNVRSSDYRALRVLSEELPTVNLPTSSKDLRGMIKRAVLSFKGAFQKNKDLAQFLFVLEDTGKGRVVGTSKIFARHGTPQRPHVYFRVMQEKVASKTLGVKFLRKFYRLKADPRGYTEIGGLVLARPYRGREEKLGKQLSLVRFLFMKAHLSWFKNRVIAELLPPLPSRSSSTLYNFYGYKLTRIPYRKADLLSYRNKEFILKLFPKSDLYYDILPKEVQADIEKTGSGSEIARRLLVEVGFKYANQIDPFDGGPYYVAAKSEIRSCRESHPRKFLGTTQVPTTRRALLLSEHQGEIRATLSSFKLSHGRLLLPPATQILLEIKPGQTVYTYPWK